MKYKYTKVTVYNKELKGHTHTVIAYVQCFEWAADTHLCFTKLPVGTFRIGEYLLQLLGLLVKGLG